jgi:hypothetical protein
MVAQWKEYIGSHEQLTEIDSAKFGFIYRRKDGSQSLKYVGSAIIDYIPAGDITHYLICEPHQLKELIQRQAETGQPVWCRYTNRMTDERVVYVTTKPDWNHHDYEYSFIPFVNLDN